MAPDTQPVLRTLAPALRELERRVHAWLIGKHRYPLNTMQRATLEGQASDLSRQSDALLMEQPLLTIVLMGGTGVGKSTLLNAIAGGAIAQASFARPTTRDPVVYYHQSITTNRLDPALQFCKLVSHDRHGLEHKVLVDTPDIDSNDLTNREKLMRILPVADIVLFVGSQEKYHDKLVWDMFLQQKERRAFAFVLNKWDRCIHPGALGSRPDEDLLRDLQAEGFKSPLLFRTCAQHWVDHPWGSKHQLADSGEAVERNGDVAPKNERPAVEPPVEGEQFLDLMRWLEAGLTRMEVEAIKARGVSKLLKQVHDAVESACPPDFAPMADRVRMSWRRLLGDEADAATSVLLNTLDPFQREIEHHFASERQRHFSGVMLWYLNAFGKLRYVGSTLRDQLPLVPKAGTSVEAPPEWSLARFTEACSAAASDQHLHARMKAMANRLLVEADTLGIPLGLLSESTENTAKLDWRTRYSQAMIDVITTVERAWSQPAGTQWWVQKVIILMTDWAPSIAFLSSAAILIWGYTMKEPARDVLWTDLFIPVIVVLLVLAMLHVLIAIFLPLRWERIREQFHQHLEKRLRTELETEFHRVLTEIVAEVQAERRQNELLVKEIDDVASWLAEREQSASIVNLYGK
jgi:energy-coupling factor transporter ATP-binding protein EcfA2